MVIFMKLKKYLAAILSFSMAISCMILPMQASAAGEDYGTVTTNSDGSITLTFGADCITQSGGGSVIDDTVNGVKRPDNLKCDTNAAAVLTMPSVDLNDSGYNKLDLYAACKNDVSVSVKVGETEIASFANVNNGSWDSYQVNTASLITTAASGNVTLNITGAAKTYCGNYVYVKLYNSNVPAATNAPASTAAPAATGAPDSDGDVLPYLDTSLSFEERAADLVSRMTLEEKVSQIGYKAAAIDRLGVKAYDYWKEALHGVARQGKATSFPVPLAMSNTWNKELIYQLADATSTEARAKNNRYNLSYWSPTVNMARDPRWGRNDETMGEDPYLTGQLGAEFVRGMQGDDDTYLKTISTLKHFAANNNEKNRSSGSSLMNEFNLRNYYTKVFQNITEEVMPASIMSSYNATSITRNGSYIYNFIPSLSNSYLLQDLLRRNWGFDGYVTSDCGAGEYMLNNAAFKTGMLGSSSLPNEQYIAELYKSGLNVECNLGGGNKSTLYGMAAVENGYLTEEELERVVYELFLQRFRTGEFDDNSSYRDITSSVIEDDAHVAIAEKTAEESWVLLKNDDNTLPLKNDVTNVAVVGNMANVLAVGDYKGSPTKITTPIAGMRKELGNMGAEISYLGEITDDEKLFNVKSITLVFSDGSTKALDLSKAESVSGMTLSNGTFTGVTQKATAVIKNVNFVNVVKVRVEMSTGSRIGGSLNIAYGQGGPGVASVSSKTTTDLDTYIVCEGDYTGADGGYNGTADMYISASPTVLDFSVENYKTQLDAADVIIAYAGTVPKQDDLGDADASESKDRSSIDLPASQAHVQAICNAYPDKTIVVMSTVGQINVEPFKDKCKAILWTSYNGQTQGTALGKVLTGEINPSGKLTTTWYANADVAKMELYGASQTIDGIKGAYTDYNIQADGTNPGHTYQYYSGTPVYPFGYGLSYTSFEYSNMTIDKTLVDANGTVRFTVDVKNTGRVSGKEAVQLYVSHPNAGSGTTPVKQLKGFEKIELEPGETTTVTFTLDVKDMYLFDEAEQKDIVPTGTYTAYIAKNANDTSNSKTFSVTGKLASTLKTVKAIPNGVSVNGLICEDGTGLTSVTTINSNLSAIMSDEVWVDLEDAESSVANPIETLSDDAESPKVLSYENGVVTITTGKTQDADLIHASYTDGVLSKVDITPVKLKENESVIVNKTDIANGDKLMLWDSVKNMKPLADALVIDNASASEGTTIVYMSSDTDIAKVDANGIVTSGTKEGVAIITIAVTVDGITKTDSYPVVNKLEIKPSADEIAAAKAELKAAYDKLPQAAYSTENLAEINKIFADANAAIESVSTKPEMEATLAKAINSMNSVPMDNLTESYSIASENSKFIEKGVIDYREGGIPMYNGASGTITNANPYTGIQLQAFGEDGNAVDNSKIVWQIQKFDDSVRKVADIDANGKLTVYGNGIIQITAANIEDMTCGKLMVQVNMQIEAEYADNANGADLTDNQSGSSGGFDAGSTGDAWIEYKSVKLSNLDSIVARYAGKNAGIINISLEKSATSGVIATASPSATGGWSTWSDVEFELNNDAIDNAQLNGTLDEYGCATIYIQTNGMNLDYFRLNYIENNDEIPYIIQKTLNKTDGKIKVSLKYRGSTLATDVKLVAEVLDTETETAKSSVSTDVKGTGEYEITTGASDGETVRLTVRDNDGKALSEYVDKVYNTPVDSEIVVYSLDGTDYDYSVLTGGTDGTVYTDTVNGLSGYGGWTLVSKSDKYTYSDVNEKTYEYSFTKAWQAGAGSQTKRSLFFTPKSPCKVTAVFLGGEAARSMTVYQDDNNNATQPGTGSLATVSIEVTDTTKPVYVYGGSSNKQLFAIIVEYYGSSAGVVTSSVEAEEVIDRPVQFLTWGNSNVVLTKHDTTGETKVWLQAAGGSRIQLDTDYFYESDVSYKSDDEYKINALAVYKDRLYAGCDGGLVIVFTNCEKCYKLKKACDIDIKQMSIVDGIMYASDGEANVEINMSDIGGDSIEADEARVLLANGAVLVDVRSVEEYAEKSVEDSVNIPIDMLEEELSSYDKDAALIFCCASGMRASSAVEKAKAMGFTNVYNLGSIDKIM
ncbi:MAG: glycoside hydrolase family 3 C-terminal domain-containing protein [Clostridia bacterium]